MHANDAKLLRVYPRERGGTVLEETFPSETGFEVVVEAKAGRTIHGDGGAYSIQIVLRDLVDFSVVYEASLESNFSDQPWDQPVLTHAFPIPPQSSGKENHIYEALASLSVGSRNPNVSFTKSPMFIIRKP